MTTPIVTHHFRHSVAEEFLESFAEDDTSYYLFYGKILPWSNESSPDVGNTAFVSHRDAWDSMVSAKRLRGDAVRFVVDKRVWAANTVYTSYDDGSTTYYSNTSNKTYVVTANSEVYKCIDNANNSNSTIEPTGTNNNNGFVRMNDGYTWKYMFPLASEPNDNLFSTTDYIPVPRFQIPSVTVVEGTVDRIIVMNSGFGYNGSNAGIDLAIVTIQGDGVGAVATANVGALGNISSVTVTSRGTGYTWANITFSGGSSATARAVLSPPGGHASAPAEEFNTKKVLLAGRVGSGGDSSEGNTFSIQNDFRQYGILKDPYKYANTAVANSNSVSQTINITVVSDANPNFTIDDFVYQIDSSGNTVFQGYVVDIGALSNTSVVKVTQFRGSVQTGGLLYNTNAATSKRIQSFENPPLEKYSGEILYFENIAKIQRNASQAETFKVLFDF
jgi:hypothetical protein